MLLCLAVFACGDEDERRTPDRVRVPEVDRTPPEAGLDFRQSGRTLDLTAVTRDPEGTGRIRVSLLYRAPCRGGLVTRNFPPAGIARILITPGTTVPARRSRSVRVRLPPCPVTGKAWADATNAHGLDAYSEPVRFRYDPEG